GVVEVDARDGLHHAAVSITEAASIHLFHAADVGASVASDRNALLAFEYAGHARGPQQLRAEMAVDELMQIAQILQQLPGLGKRGRDELDQRFGIVGRDVLVSQRRTERRRMRALLDPALRRDPQRLFLDAL